MKTLIVTLSLALAATTLPNAAAADCYVEYKAKQDSPLRLHYGVLSLNGDCPGKKAAARAASSRLEAGGWTLLNIVGLSDKTPSDKKRANAGDFYLRF